MTNRLTAIQMTDLLMQCCRKVALLSQGVIITMSE